MRIGPEKRDYRRLGICRFPHDDKPTYQDLALFLLPIHFRNHQDPWSRMSAAMREYLNLRASETLGQEELVAFLENRFPKATRPIGRQVIEGTKCVETRVRTDSQEFREEVFSPAR